MILNLSRYEIQEHLDPLKNSDYTLYPGRRYIKPQKYWILFASVLASYDSFNSKFMDNAALSKSGSTFCSCSPVSIGRLPKRESITS